MLEGIHTSTAMLVAVRLAFATTSPRYSRSSTTRRGSFPGTDRSRAKPQWFHDLVAQTIEHIEGEKRAGKTLEAIQSAGLPKKFEAAGKAGFIPESVWIQFVYASLDP